MPQHDDIKDMANSCAPRVKRRLRLDKGISTIDAKHRQSVQMRQINRPCIQCGALVRSKTRCADCERKRQATRNQARQYYKGDYAKRARLVRQSALVCALCHLPPTSTDPLTADHVEPGVPSSPLRAAHRSCNSARGNRV